MFRKIASIVLMVILCLFVIGCARQNNEKTEQVINPVEERKTLLRNAYINCCDSNSSFASLSSDGTSLVIDTNPNDTKYSYHYEDEALRAIVATNNHLKFPASITDKMASTRALDGMQSQSSGDFTATWTYHPDKGLKVIYEVKFS